MNGHMISIHADGLFNRVNVLTEDLLNIGNQKVDVVEEINLQLQDIFEEDSGEEDQVIDTDLMYEIIETNSFIGLRSPKTSLELLFVVKVISKGIADTYIEDDRGHGIVMGEHYVSGYYLDKVDESNRSIKFSLPKRNVLSFIHIGEIFATNIELSKQLLMDINEYRSLCEELY